MKRNIKLLLEDILENIDLIEKSTNKSNKEEFLNDRLLQDATVRRLEVIGEAAKNILEDTKEKYPEVEWKKIVGTRDRITHAYFRVDLDIVWDIIKKDLPELKKKIQKILKEIS